MNQSTSQNHNVPQSKSMTKVSAPVPKVSPVAKIPVSKAPAKAPAEKVLTDKTPAPKAIIDKPSTPKAPAVKAAMDKSSTPKAPTPKLPMTKPPETSDRHGHMFVFISAKTCPACMKFKMDWSSIKAQLDKLVSIIEIEVPKPSDAKNISNPIYPSGIGLICSYVPILLLIPKSSWNAKKLDGILVYGTTIKNGKAVVPSGLKMSLASVVEWVKNNITI